MTYRLKRVIDVLIASMMLIIAAPFMLIFSALILSCMGRPIIFKHQRAGINGCTISIFKFRTMNNRTDELDKLLPSSMRITRLGKYLREFSLDELPQLLNVLGGDMSLVGPRPLLVEYSPLYNSHQRRRLNVKPGITGWAQLNGRNMLSWEERFKCDVWYVNNQSIRLDFIILLRTLVKVLKREGISPNDSEIMRRFDVVSKGLAEK